MKDKKTKASPLKNSLPYIAGVILSLLVSFYIRTGSKASVILSENFVRFGGNDPWYHMRVVSTILHNYPHNLWFEAYTLFPTGQRMVFAPLFDWVLASLIYVLTLGNPSTHQMEVIGAYFPALLGTLVVIPTYYVGKWIFNRNVGLLSAFLIAILPGAFLHRSLLGFTDHHVAETLMSTVTAMFLIMSLKTMREHPVNFDDILAKDFSKLKPSMKYIVLTGISMGLYALAWKGALFFALIIGVYITIQHIIDHLRNENPEYLAIIGAISFFIAFAIIAPMPDLGSSKSQYMLGLPAGIIGFVVFSLISRFMNQRKMNRKYFALAPVGLFMTVLIISKLFIPTVYATIISVFGYFMRSGGGLTIAEAYPFFVDRSTGLFSLSPLYDNFGIEGYIAFLAIPVLLYQTYREHKQEEIWLVVWTMMMVWALYQQNRFAYYFAVNAALLSAYLAVKILEAVGWKELYEKYLLSKEKGRPFESKNIKAIHILTMLILFIVLIYPVGPLQESTSQNTGVGGPEAAWIESLTWLRYNTPDTGVDFYELYETPAEGETYQYPDTAYGIMSWWDYGHWITYIGHRIPNANPFQSGIGGGDVPGAASYFTSQSEEEANTIADVLGSRYIISNGRMAYTIFGAMAAWDGDESGYYTQVNSDQGLVNVPSMKYLNSMEMKLHLLDGSGLRHYRMVHESQAYNPSHEPYVDLEYFYKNIYNMWTGENIPIESASGFVKIFEYVDGATVTGTAPENETVAISTTIMTNQMRTFTYTQSTTAGSDGAYSFTVPYSTEGTMEGETQFDTMPVGPYVISYRTVTEQVSISEADILNGNIIEI
ncbi:oligosaccharyl transferase, archaeosortase A system-associated [Methanolobus psychrotolerans]|uniref:oligosaccharyl transferase, archaeosortase A system-associated n=1 Tax=Methanolobus psychrotolerans TaxID=1874706 RepID=UPI000B916F18|nr:oligosaccharyl transferase, archaeosortase A system-associated [Methanolobus psychrotolerans]